MLCEFYELIRQHRSVKAGVFLGGPRHALGTRWIVEMRVRVDDAGKQRAAKKIVSGQCGGRRCGCSRKKRSSALRACGVRKKHTCSIK